MFHDFAFVDGPSRLLFSLLLTKCTKPKKLRQKFLILFDCVRMVVCLRLPMIELLFKFHFNQVLFKLFTFMLDCVFCQFEHVIEKEVNGSMVMCVSL